MKKLFLATLLVLFCSTLFAQNKVTGRVTSSEDGNPIPFASVVVKGTMNGVATDDNGVYTITGITPGAILEFSSVGFLTQEVQWDGKPAVNVILAVDRESLDEAMVVAYGTVKKGSYSGSAAVVKQESIKDAPVVSFEQVLAGKAPGVQVASYSGQPGADTEINIRGFGSFNAGNQPLYVIDGVPATSRDQGWGNLSIGSMNFLNPGDIESITILKDA
ncbi:MAG: TonB-dependent receptor plug domain-containing protein, partial [Bacteroidales bacterium]|nr:TonB-dependent receptor plug domain-containing protein [Bacteroidales bacterium]